MAELRLKSLENPKYLKCASSEFDDIVLKLTKKEKSDVALKCLIEIYRLMEKKAEWKNNVDASSLCSFSSYICSFIEININPSDLQKYLATVCNIFRCVVKKKCDLDLILNLSKYVFLNPKVKMKVDYSKTYWIILVDCFNALEFVPVKQYNNNVKIVINNTLKYCEIIKQINTENLLWIIRKYFDLLNGTEADALDIFFEKLMLTLINNQNILKCTKAELKDMFKNLLYCYSYIHQNLANCGYDRKGSTKAFLNLCVKIFKSEFNYITLIQSFFPVSCIFISKLDQIDSNSCKIISEFLNKIAHFEKQNTKEFKEFCTFFRKIFSSILSSWLAVSDEVWKNYIPIEFQDLLLKLILSITKILRKSDVQTLKCANCNFKSGIHDSIQLSCYVGKIVIKSATCGLDITNLIESMKLVSAEHIKNLNVLFINGCPNWKTFWSRIEMEQQNDAIRLYTLKNYAHSNFILKCYTSSFGHILMWDVESCNMAHLARGFFNMAICQLDLNEYFNALISCYVSVALNNLTNKDSNEVASSQFALQIKAKIHSQTQAKTENTTNTKSEGVKDQKDTNYLLSLTVWSGCQEFLKNKHNIGFGKLFAKLAFGQILLKELEDCIRIWPSTHLIVGICQSYKELFQLASPHSKPTTEAECFGDLDIKNLSFVCGKVITLMINNSTKLNNPQILEFIVMTMEHLEHVLKDDDDFTHNIVAKLFLGNTKFAHTLYKIQEKRRINLEKSSYENKPKLSTDNISNLNFPIPKLPKVAPAPEHPDDACDVTPANQYLSLAVEDEIMQSAYTAVELWRDSVVQIGLSKDKFISNAEYQPFITLTADIIELACQMFYLQDIDVYSLYAADIGYDLAVLANNNVCILRTSGFLLEHAACPESTMNTVIQNANKISKDILSTDETAPTDSIIINAVFEYILNLSIYYYNIGLKQKGAIILSSVHSRIMSLYINNDKDDRKVEGLKLTIARLITVESFYMTHIEHNAANTTKSLGILTCYVNANVECGEVLKLFEHSRDRNALVSQRMWLNASLRAGVAALSLGLVRRARALLSSPLIGAQRLLLPRRSARFLSVLAQADIAAERCDDCAVKVEGISYILGERHTVTIVKNPQKDEVKASNISKKKPRDCGTNTRSSRSKNMKQFEMVLDVPMEKRRDHSVGGSPTFQPEPFREPEFIHHLHTCQCCKCLSQLIFVLYLELYTNQALLYFRTGESRTTESIYNGGLKLMKHLNARIKYNIKNNSNKFINNFSLSILEKINNIGLVNAECKFKIDASNYWITENETEKVSKYNTEVFNRLISIPNPDYFLIQLVNEQNMFLENMHVFNRDKDIGSHLDIVDDIQSDIASKLIITPKKSKPIKSEISLCKAPMRK